LLHGIKAIGVVFVKKIVYSDYELSTIFQGTAMNSIKINSERSGKQFLARLTFLFSCLVSSAWAQDTHVVLQEDLSQFKSDFNAAVDQVRLVFIVGPN